MVKTLFKKLFYFFGYEYKYGSLRSNKRVKKIYNFQLSSIEGNNLISSKLKQSEPFIVSRLGASELMLVLNYLHFRKRKKNQWNDYLKDEINRQSGVFPTDDKILNHFSEVYLEAIQKIDVLGIWKNDGEDFIIEKFCPRSNLVPLESLEPYFFHEPWSVALAGKKVLVIHPFEVSIKMQFSQRDKLFLNKLILPEFQLITIKAVQTHVYNETEFQNWFEAIDYMKKQILGIDFDVAIIGAGAYGLPLASFIKEIGKQAIHMGGATQILFGIKGKRWEERDEFRSLFNEYWKNPEDSEKPKHYKKLENGAYW